MCGIIGAVGSENVVPFLIHGLKMLEYRGYDSAGIAVMNPGLSCLRSLGRVAQLESISGDTKGFTGIAHTRWATHGVPAERNSHPHCSSHVAVVHNGIIENHDEIRTRLQGEGYVFLSETDTEVIAHLVHSFMRRGKTMFDAVSFAVRELSGAYAISVISERCPDTMVGARNGAPLLIGIGEGENFFASDASALINTTNRVIYLHDGDVAELNSREVVIHDAYGKVVTRPVHISKLSSAAVELGNYQHYMQKEIFQQPQAIRDTLEMVINAHSITPQLFGSETEAVLREIDSILILACGTSFHSGLAAKYWLEEVAGVRCSIEIASEYRYRKSVPNPRELVITISQSGETADTLAALQYAIENGHKYSLTICNVPESSIVRASQLRFITRAGPEIGVASTKAFTTQLSALALFTLVLAKLRGSLSLTQEGEYLTILRALPDVVGVVLSSVEPKIKQWANQLAQSGNAFYLGRGIHYPIAMEGALKLKEVTYIHAEAFAAGELKHGPLALIDKGVPVVVIAPNDQLIGKLKSNIEEVRARGGELFVITDRGTGIAEGDGLNVIELGDYAEMLSPIVHTICLQLLAYHVALVKGTDVDKPRNLAKSVTVE